MPQGGDRVARGGRSSRQWQLNPGASVQPGEPSSVGPVLVTKALQHVHGPWAESVVGQPPWSAGGTEPGPQSPRSPDTACLRP